ncbi:FERM and PDZ domain-containing protein 1 isoform X2 [Lissotriton helveticus]
MEDKENSLFQARKAKRIEQMVARWLRRSRDNLPRSRISVTDCSSGSQQFTAPVKITTVIHKDLFLNNYGFEISQNHPLSIASVIAGGPADGKLMPGDQILKLHNEAVEDMSIEQAVDIIRQSEDSVPITVLRYPSGPKSSFLTAEKRARLKCNPVKVRFAEEVLVNGHTQGNSLLFMPNVLKVYLENGQTKAFKFEKKTTVKDIILTLKEKLSINSIEHFALALEEQYNIAKLYLLHDEELIEQVVQKRESHDYRCLFRVCFVPRDPWDLLQEDPVVFEYLYLQSCSDVLQERFAVEMKCSVALRLAALHIQERIFSCAQPQKISMKYIEKDWGIENFISPTLLRNMRGKDIKKAINFHMKRNQALLDPRQKPLSAAQVRLSYLKILGELKTYGGKIFNATLLLQDRESHVSLLVGAKYGISQIVNNKLNIMSTLAEFASITRIELTSESEKVSMMKVYLQDVKPLTLLLESNNAKDLACLISGYYKLFVDSGNPLFPWNSDRLMHRLSAEEGYESRVCSDSEESSELDSFMEFSSDFHHLKYSAIKPLQEEEEEEEDEFADRFEQVADETGDGVGEIVPCDCSNNGTDSASEISDSATAESKGCKISWSSDSIDALEEDDLEACSSSRPEFFQFYTPCLKEMDSEYNVFSADGREIQTETENGRAGFDPLLCFLQCSPPVTDTIAYQLESNRRHGSTDQKEENELNTFTLGCHFYENNIMEYYSLCSNVSPASSVERNLLNSPDSFSPKEPFDETEKRYIMNVNDLIPEVECLILSPPPGFGDSSSEEEFFDAAERLTPTQPSSGSNMVSWHQESKFNFQISGSGIDLEDNHILRQYKKETRRTAKESNRSANTTRKRRSFLQTDYTSQVTFPLTPSSSLERVDHVCCYERVTQLSSDTHSQTLSSLKNTEGEPSLLENKPLTLLPPQEENKSKSPSSSLMEMEPDTMETKSITDTIISSISATRFRTAQECRGGPDLSLHDPSCPDSKEVKGTFSDSPFFCDEGGRTSPSDIYLHMEENESPEEGGTPQLRSQPGYCIIARSTLEEDVAEPEQRVEENNGRNVTDGDKLGPCNVFGMAHQKETLCSLEDLTNGSMDQCGGQNVEVLLSHNSVTKDTKNEATFTQSPNMHPQVQGGQTVEEVGQREPQMGKGIDFALAMNHFESILNPSQYRVDPRWREKDQSANQSQIKSGLELPTRPNTCYQIDDSMAKCIKVHNDTSLQSEMLQQYNNNPSTIWENSNFIPYCSDQPPVECSSNTQAPLSSSAVVSSDFTSNQNVSLHQAGEENCSCRLAYTNCFSGPDTEVDDDNIDSEPSISSLPMTTPPSSGSLLSVDMKIFDISDGRQEVVSPLSGVDNFFCSHYSLESLGRLEDSTSEMASDFSQLQDQVEDLQKVFENYSGSSLSHPEDKCAIRFFDDKQALCAVSRKLMSNCQKVIKVDPSPKQMQSALHDTFRNLIDLTRVCLQLTGCDQCTKRQISVLTNLKDVVFTYHQFVQAARKACERDCSDLSIKLLARQCTALTAATFCLTQQFKSLTP